MWNLKALPLTNFKYKKLIQLLLRMFLMCVIAVVDESNLSISLKRGSFLGQTYKTVKSNRVKQQNIIGLFPSIIGQFPSPSPKKKKKKFLYIPPKKFLVFQRMELSRPKSEKFLTFFHKNIFLYFMKELSKPKNKDLL